MKLIDGDALLHETFSVPISDAGHSQEWKDGVCQGIKDALRAVANTVRNAPTVAQTCNEWISVKERLPQDEQWVAALLYGLVGYNTILLQYNAMPKEFITDDGIEYDIDDVAYWVGLPEPPEVGG